MGQKAMSYFPMLLPFLYSPKFPLNGPTKPFYRYRQIPLALPFGRPKTKLSHVVEGMSASFLVLRNSLRHCVYE
jgi:hypothetical protein